jgi:hypothetical protein
MLPDDFSATPSPSYGQEVNTAGFTAPSLTFE